MKSVLGHQSPLSAKAQEEMRTAGVIVAIVLLGLLMLVIFRDSVIPNLILPKGRHPIHETGQASLLR